MLLKKIGTAIAITVAALSAMTYCFASAAHFQEFVNDSPDLSAFVKVQYGCLIGILGISGFAVCIGGVTGVVLSWERLSDTEAAQRKGDWLYITHDGMGNFYATTYKRKGGNPRKIPNPFLHGSFHE